MLHLSRFVTTYCHTITLQKTIAHVDLSLGGCLIFGDIYNKLWVVVGCPLVL